MDWALAIRRKQRELAAIIATLLAMVAVCAGRSQRKAVLRILRPAESTLRRLIVIYQRERLAAGSIDHAAIVCQTTQPQRPLPDFSSFTANPDRLRAFRLIDPRKRFGPVDYAEGAPASQGPRIWSWGMARHEPPQRTAPARAKTIPDMASLKRRVAALDHALKTLPKQARRMSRLMARRAKAPPGPRCVGPVRPGWPPGHRRRPSHPIDEILRDCHALAFDSINHDQSRRPEGVRRRSGMPAF